MCWCTVIDAPSQLFLLLFLLVLQNLTFSFSTSPKTYVRASVRVCVCACVCACVRACVLSTRDCMRPETVLIPTSNLWREQNRGSGRQPVADSSAKEVLRVYIRGVFSEKCDRQDFVRRASARVKRVTANCRALRRKREREDGSRIKKTGKMQRNKIDL